jgi:hypothetical protein
MSAYTEEYVEDSRSDVHDDGANASSDKNDENRTMTTIHVSNLDAKAII